MPYTLNPFSGNFDYHKSTIAYGTSHPVTADNGTLFYDTDDGVLYIYVNGWISIGSGTPSVPSLIPFGLVYIPQ